MVNNFFPFFSFFFFIEFFSIYVDGILLASKDFAN